MPAAATGAGGTSRLDKSPLPAAPARGRLGWLAGSSSRFVLALDDTSAAAPPTADVVSIIPFAEVDAASLTEFAEGLRQMPTNAAGAYDPPLHFSIRT